MKPTTKPDYNPTPAVAEIMAPAWKALRKADGKVRYELNIDWVTVRRCDVALIEHYMPYMPAADRWRAEDTIKHLRWIWDL